MKQSVFLIIVVLLSMQSSVSAQDKELRTRNIIYVDAEPLPQRGGGPGWHE